MFSSASHYPRVKTMQIFSLSLERFLILNSGSLSDGFDGDITNLAGF